MGVASGSQARGRRICTAIVADCTFSLVHVQLLLHRLCSAPNFHPSSAGSLTAPGQFDHLSKHVTASRFHAVIEIAISASSSVLMQYRQEIIYRPQSVTARAFSPLPNIIFKRCDSKNTYNGSGRTIQNIHVIIFPQICIFTGSRYTHLLQFCEIGRAHV